MRHYLSRKRNVAHLVDLNRIDQKCCIDFEILMHCLDCFTGISQIADVALLQDVFLAYASLV